MADSGSGKGQDIEIREDQVAALGVGDYQISGSGTLEGMIPHSFSPVQARDGRGFFEIL